MLLPRIIASGLPGKRVEAYRDGIIPMMFMAEWFELKEAVYFGINFLNNDT